MSDAINSKPSTNFWIISGAALVWNLIGLVFYVGHVSITPEALAAMTEAHQEFLLTTPTWAIPVFAISLAGIVVQDVDAFVLRDAYSILGVNSLIIPSMVFVIGVAILLYARVAKRCGWLN